jgi:hypothetical protein
MKKSLSIASAVIVNVTLLTALINLFNPFNRDLGFLITRPDWLFSPSPDYNIVLVGSFLGLIVFNLNLLLNRKK